MIKYNGMNNGHLQGLYGLSEALNTPPAGIPTCVALKNIWESARFPNLSTVCLERYNSCFPLAKKANVSFQEQDKNCAFSINSKEVERFETKVQDGQHDLRVLSRHGWLWVKTDFRNSFNIVWSKYPIPSEGTEHNRPICNRELNINFDPNLPDRVEMYCRYEDAEFKANCPIGENGSISCVLSSSKVLSSLFPTINIETTKKEVKPGVFHFTFDIAARSSLLSTVRQLGQLEFSYDMNNNGFEVEGALTNLDGLTLFAGYLKCGDPKTCSGAAYLTYDEEDRKSAVVDFHSVPNKFRLGINDTQALQKRSIE